MLLGWSAPETDYWKNLHCHTYSSNTVITSCISFETKLEKYGERIRVNSFEKTYLNNEVSSWIGGHSFQLVQNLLKSWAADGVDQPTFDHQHEQVQSADVWLRQPLSAVQML